MSTIQANSQVSLFYQLLLEDGTEVESNFGEEPLEIVMGDGTLSEGMELALLNQKKGDKVDITLSPEQGYGYPDEEKVHNIPLADFPDDMQPEPGQVIAFDGPDDEEIVGTILEINGDDVSVDFSHPLSGRTLVFKAEILDVSNPD